MPLDRKRPILAATIKCGDDRGWVIYAEAGNILEFLPDGGAGKEVLKSQYGDVAITGMMEITPKAFAMIRNLISMGSRVMTGHPQRQACRGFQHAPGCKHT